MGAIAVAVSGALSWVVNLMIGNLKNQIKNNQKAYEKRIAVQEGKTDEYEKDRDSLRSDLEKTDIKLGKIETILGIVSECPADSCPNRNIKL
jgi:hypothetical protein